MDVVPLEFQDKNLQISFHTWELLRQNIGTNVYNSIRAAAEGTIQRGGAFLIYKADRSVWRQCNYLSELDEVLGGR